MEKKKNNRKMGWFGWTMTIVIVVTIIGSSLFFYSFFNLNLTSVFNGEDTAGATEQGDLSKEGKDEIERVRATVGEEHADLGQFVSDIHGFYNKTTGYGGINNLAWSEQQEQAEFVVDTIEKMRAAITDEMLLADLETIHDLALKAIDQENQETIRSLHRYFHDLDIALNDYTSYDKIWNVTDTLKDVE